MEATVKFLDVPIKLLGKVQTVQLKIIYPHEIFSILFHYYPGEFAKRFYGDSVQQIAAFWDSQRDHPSYATHPMHTRSEPDFIPQPFREKGVPLFLHGDDVASVGVGKIWSKAAGCLSFGGLLAARECAFNVHLIIWLLFNNILCTADDAAKTMQVLWQHFTWSLYWLSVGRHPDRDAFGNMYTVGPEFEKANTPLASVFFGILWAGRMDIDYNQSRFKMARPSE